MSVKADTLKFCLTFFTMLLIDPVEANLSGGAINGFINYNTTPYKFNPN